MRVLTEIDNFPGHGFASLAQIRGTLADVRIGEAVRLIDKVGGIRVGFIGLACAPSADGSQDSPILDVMQQLADSGREVAAFDPALYMPTDQRSLGPMGAIRASTNDVIDWCQTLVVTYHSRALQAAIAARRGRCHLIDLIDLFAEQPVTPARTKSATRCRLSQKSH